MVSMNVQLSGGNTVVEMCKSSMNKSSDYIVTLEDGVTIYAESDTIIIDMSEFGL